MAVQECVTVMLMGVGPTSQGILVLSAQAACLGQLLEQRVQDGRHRILNTGHDSDLLSETDSA